MIGDSLANFVGEGVGQACCLGIVQSACVDSVGLVRLR